MPFLNQKDLPGSTAAARFSETPAREVGFLEELAENAGEKAKIVRAAFRIENPIAAMVASEHVAKTVKNPEFDRFAAIQGTFLENFPESVLWADSEEDLERVERNLREELDARRTLANGGGFAFAANFAAGLFDPFILIPVGGAARTALSAGRAGRFLSGAVNTAKAGLIGSSASELALGTLQETRTFGESAINISAATFLSGALGGAIGGFTKPQLRTMLGQVKKDAGLDPAAPRVTPEAKSADAVAGGSVADAEPFPVTPRRAFSEGKGFPIDADDETLLKAAVGQKTFRRMSPLMRLTTSPLKTARQLQARLIDSPFITKGNVADVTSAVPAEKKIRTHVAQTAGAKDFITDAFVRYRQRVAGREVKGGGRLELAKFGAIDVGRPGSDARLSFARFREEISIAARRDDASPIPEVKESAEHLRKNLWNPGLDLLKEARLMPDDFDPSDVKFAQSWLMRVYNVDKVVADSSGPTGKSFRNILETHFKFFPKTAPSDELVKGSKVAVPDRGNIGTITSIKDGNARVRITNPESGASVNKQFPVAELEAVPLTNAQIADIAQETINKITGKGDGRLLYDQLQFVTASTRDRSLAVTDEAIEEFLENDIFEIIDTYGRTVFPDAELALELGARELNEEAAEAAARSVDEGEVPEVAPPFERFSITKAVDEEITKIRDDLVEMQKTATVKERLALEREFKSARNDLLSVVSLLRGKFVVGALPADSAIYRTGRAIRQLNTLRFGGGFTISSIPDTFRPVMVMGMDRVIGDGIRPLIGNIEGLRLSAAENRLAGVGWELTMDSRAKSLSDLSDQFKPGTRFEKGLDALTHNFFMLNGLSGWNQIFKHWSGVMVQSRMLDAVQMQRAGTIIDKDRIWLRRNGISPEDAAAMADLFDRHGATIDGMRIANTERWEDGRLTELFRTSLLSEVDNIIVTPRVADKPTLMNTELGRAMFQFKSFAISATQRVMLSGMQSPDQAYFLGMLGSVFMGSMAYAFKQLGKDRSISTNPLVVIGEGVDRSGVLGVLGDVNGVFERLGLGVNRLATGQTLSRFAHRNFLSALAGPTAGTVSSAAQILAGIGQGQLTQGDVREVRRLLPYSQVFYIQNAVNAIEKGIVTHLGIPKSRPQKKKN